MWQKARIVLTHKHPECLGREIWVVAESPRVQYCHDIETGDVQQADGFTSNIEDELQCIVRREVVELIPEFADDVPLISWQSFLKGATDAKPA